jgi:hypothetical protein
MSQCGPTQLVDFSKGMKNSIAWHAQNLGEKKSVWGLDESDNGRGVIAWLGGWRLPARRIERIGVPAIRNVIAIRIGQEWVRPDSNFLRVC